MINDALGCMTEEMIEALKCREEQEREAQAAALAKKKAKDDVKNPKAVKDPKDPKNGSPQGGNPKGGSSADGAVGATGAPPADGGAVGASSDPPADAATSNNSPHITSESYSSFDQTNGEPYVPVLIVEDNLNLLAESSAEDECDPQNILEMFDQLVANEALELHSPTAAPGLTDWSGAKAFSSIDKEETADDSQIAKLLTSAAATSLDHLEPWLTDDHATVEHTTPSHEPESVSSEMSDVKPVELEETHFLIEPPIAEGTEPLTGAEDTVSRPGPGFEIPEWPGSENDLPFIKRPTVDSNEKSEKPFSLQIPPVAECTQMAAKAVVGSVASGANSVQSNIQKPSNDNKEGFCPTETPIAQEVRRSEPLRSTALSQEHLDDSMQNSIIEQFDKQCLANMAPNHFKDRQAIAASKPGHACPGANLDDNAVGTQAKYPDRINCQSADNLSKVAESSDLDAECDDQSEKNKKSIMGNLLGYVTKFWKDPKND